MQPWQEEEVRRRSPASYPAIVNCNCCGTPHKVDGPPEEHELLIIDQNMGPSPPGYWCSRCDERMWEDVRSFGTGDWSER